MIDDSRRATPVGPACAGQTAPRHSPGAGAGPTSARSADALITERPSSAAVWGCSRGERFISSDQSYFGLT